MASGDLKLALKLSIGQASQSMRRFTDGAARNLDSLSNKTKRMSRETAQLSRDFKGLTNQTKLLGAAFGVLSMRAVLGDMIDIERAMLRVESNLVGGAKSAGDLRGQLKEVRDTAREIDKLTGLGDVAGINATNQLLKAGVAPKVVHGTDGAAMASMALAKLGEVSPDSASDFLGATGNAFNFKSKKDYHDFANHVIKADDASAMHSAEIIYNMQQSSASAAALHIDPKRLVSALAYLDPLKNEAGTAMNRLMENLAGPTKQKAKWLKKSGMQFWQTDANGHEHVKDLGEVIEIIRKKFKSMTSDKDKSILGQRIFGEEGKRAAEFFTHKDLSFTAFENQVEHATSFEKKLEIQMQGLGAAMDNLKNSTLAAIDKQGQPVLHGLTGGANALTRMIDNGQGGDLLAGAAGLAGLAVLSKVNKRRKARLAGAAASHAEQLEAVAQAAKGMRVFVTNWPDSMKSTSEKLRDKAERNKTVVGGGVDSGPEGNKTSKLGKVAKGLGSAFALGSSGMIGWEIGSAAAEVIDATLQTITNNEHTNLGSWLYDKLHDPIPVDVRVSVQNGNITANIIDSQKREARRY